MAHDSALAALLSGALLLQAAAAPQVAMSDAQVLGVSVGCGLIGGVISTLADATRDTHWSEWVKRAMASGMVAPALVVVAILQLFPERTLLLVTASAGVAGLVAWPVSQLLPKLAPGAIRDALKGWIGGAR